MTPITKQHVEELIDRLVDTKWGIEGGSFVFTSRVLIGDVLERMLAEVIPNSFLSNDSFEGRASQVMMLWRPCGFTKSLQEIAGCIVWEGESIGGRTKEGLAFDLSGFTAKPSPEADLLLFIHNLGL